MKISVETVPHSTQRYDTVGDWTFEPDGTLNVNVSIMTEKTLEKTDGDLSGVVREKESEDSEFLVAIHEIVEAYLCKKAGITAEEVDAFDFAATKSISTEHTPFDEPGEDPRAPYHVQHMIAQSIEMMLCSQLGLSWEEHNKRVMEVE